MDTTEKSQGATADGGSEDYNILKKQAELWKEVSEYLEEVAKLSTELAEAHEDVAHHLNLQLQVLSSTSATEHDVAKAQSNVQLRENRIGRLEQQMKELQEAGKDLREAAEGMGLTQVLEMLDETDSYEKLMKDVSSG